MKLTSGLSVGHARVGRSAGVRYEAACTQAIGYGRNAQPLAGRCDFPVQWSSPRLLSAQVGIEVDLRRSSPTEAWRT
jgi:hypothetical protein